MLRLSISFCEFFYFSHFGLFCRKRCEQLYGGDERIDKHVVHEILEYAQQKTKLPGSSTACLVTLSTLHVIFSFLSFSLSFLKFSSGTPLLLCWKCW